jgi:hypothetical protein
MRETLFPACHAQQFDIEFDIPMPGQAEFLEGGIEGLAVGLLGIGEGAVHVEDDCPQAHLVNPA